MQELNHDSKSPERKILLISYHFPPSAAVGGFRAANFAKHLSSFGWIPEVLTREDRNVDEVDWERLKDVGTIKIIKAGELPTLHQAYLGLKRGCCRILKKDFAPQNDLERSNSSNLGPSGPEKLSHRLKRYAASLLFTLPDAAKGWILPAVFRAAREIRRERISCILTSCPPYSVHLIGMLVKGMTGVKWVADFRDPWMTKGYKIVFPTCALSNKIESRLEKKVVHNADLVMFNVQPLRDAYQNRYGNEPASKFIYIPNGIVTENFSQLRHLKRYEKFTLSYTGTLYGYRSPEPIFKAINQLFMEGRVDLKGINIKLVGNCRQVGSYPILPMIRAYGLEQVVDVLDPVPHLEALKFIRQSHVALLFAPSQPFQIPGKVYDYIGIGTRILAIAEESATSDLIQSSRCGRAFHPSDIEGIKEFIFQAMDSERSILEEESTDVSQFDARRITESLSNNLNRIIV